MKILIETECGDMMCGRCAALSQGRGGDDRYCGVFQVDLPDYHIEEDPSRCTDCLATYPAASTTPEHRAAEEYAKQLADCRKLKMHTMEE